MVRVAKDAAVGFCQGPCRLLIKTAESTKDRTHDSSMRDDGDRAAFGLAEEIACLGHHSCFEYLDGFSIRWRQAGKGFEPVLSERRVKLLNLLPGQTLP